MTWVFKKSLDGAAAVLKEQLDLAKGNKCSVSVSTTFCDQLAIIIAKRKRYLESLV